MRLILPDVAARLRRAAYDRDAMANTPQDVRIRAMRVDDTSALSTPGWHHAFDDRLVRHLLQTDPAGCWVADEDGHVVGFAIGVVRELTWILAAYAVLPEHRAHGIGRQLFLAAAGHGQGCLRGLLAPPRDPAATRHYRAVGFNLHPLMHLVGAVDRATLPIVDRVREGTGTDIDLMDSVDRRTRGAAHGPDHHLLLESSRLIVVDRTTGSGYAYLTPEGSPALLAATNRRTATDLLWEALASAPGGTVMRVDRVTAANQWALDVGLEAGLVLGQTGYLGVRRLEPPAPYLPHPTLL